MKKRVFLDYASITPVDSKVEAEMKEIQKEFWANPSSLHTEGELAKNILEKARINIARILHCRSSEIFFTSGGTESLNIAILGVVKSAKKNGITPHIVTSTIEHPAVLEPIKFLLKEKTVEVSFVSPDENGIINPESIKKEIKENTVLVAIQHANNEIGVIQPIREIRKIIDLTPNPLSLLRRGGKRERIRPLLLVDASQSILYENVSLERLGADILVLDGIKMYGPRSMGILVVKHSIKISPIIFGGGQENSLRPGTENVAGAVGLAKALEIAVSKREKESRRLTELRNYTIVKIGKEIPNSSLNGGLENRLPNNINICFATPKLSAKAGFQKVDSEFLVIKLDTLGFAASAASACHTLTLENGSYVIEALGKHHCADSSLRITLGRSTKKSDLDSLISALKKIVK
ncbi:MAG: cysteine desulfurase family protein [Candidatus Zambryskibacteria bacterium]